MEAKFNGSFKESSFVNLNNLLQISDMKKNIILKSLQKNKKYFSQNLSRRDNSFLKETGYFPKFNYLDNSTQKSRNYEDFSLNKSKRIDMNSFQKSKTKFNSFHETNKTKPIETFKIKIDKSPSFILEILNRKFDDPDATNFSESKQILQGLSRQKERFQKLNSFKEEIMNYFRKFILANPLFPEETIDSLELLFVEYEKIIEILQEWVKTSCKKLEQNKKILEDNKNNEAAQLNCYYDTIVEILNFTLRINQKKHSDLQIPLDNEKMEKEWHQKLNEHKIRFSTDFPNSKLLQTFKDIDIFYEELFKTIYQYKMEKDLLQKDHDNFMKNFENLLKIKNTIEFFNKKSQPTNLHPELDQNINNSMEFLHKFDNIYQKNIDELNIKNEKLENEILSLRERLRNSTMDAMNYSKKLKKHQVVAKKHKETQVNINQLSENSNEITNTKNLLLKAISPIINGIRLPDSFIFATLNLIFGEKILQDQNCYLESKPFQKMQNFCLQWFLAKFGNQSFTNAILQDFFASFKALLLHERCQIFNNLCGLKDETTENDDSDFFTAFYSSNKAVVIYLNILCFIQFDIKRNKVFSPFFSNLADQFTINYEEVINVLDHVSKNFENDLSTDIIKSFKTAIEKKKIKTFEKKINKRKNSLLDLISHNDKTQMYSNLCIHIDVLCKFILDIFATEFDKKMNEIINSLKLIQINRKSNDFFHEDFVKILSKIFPHKTQKFFDESFSYFIYSNNNPSFSSFHDLLKNIAPMFSDLNNSNIFYVNNENISNKQKFIDPASYIIIIAVLYENLNAKIKTAEIKNDNLFALHESFKKDFAKFPKIVDDPSKIIYIDSERKEILEKLENLWKCFKKIIDILFSQSDS